MAQAPKLNRWQQKVQDRLAAKGATDEADKNNPLIAKMEDFHQIKLTSIKGLITGPHGMFGGKIKQPSLLFSDSQFAYDQVLIMINVPSVPAADEDEKFETSIKRTHAALFKALFVCLLGFAPTVLI